MDVGDRAGGRFELEQLAGSGAMARVFRARDTASGDLVAVKVLRPLGSEYERRFAREANVLATLEHPGIVRYIDHGSNEAGEHYLAMEWLEGEDLSQRLNREALSVDDSILLVRQVCSALAVAHKAGVIHRDLKPSNLFLPDGSVERVKILDFGVARLLDPSATATHIGTRVGTVQYMSPEQARGEANVGATTDVWAIGCVLFECVTGRPAFPGENDVAVLAKLVLEDPPRAQALKGEVPSELDDLLIDLLQKSASARPADARAVLAALDALPFAPGKTIVDSAPPAGMVSTAEKRLLCIVMVGPEIVSEDPDTTAPLDPSPKRKRSVLEPSLGVYGGRLEILGEGSLVITLSGAGSATDLAARAARCALTAHKLMPRASIAMAMGWGELQGKTPVGEVIDATAALLCKNEGRDSGVRIDRVSLGLLDTHFVVERDEHGHRLTHELPGLDASRTLLGQHRSFVGRNREMTTLRALFSECVEESVARVALVSGTAGCGKSRLRFELLRKLRESTPNAVIFIARGEPIRGGAPFGLLAEALKRAAGVDTSKRLAENRRRIEEMVGRNLPGGPKTRVSAFLGELIGVPFADDDNVELRAARADPRLMSDQIRRAWEDWLTGETMANPVVLVLEDLHWGDRPTVELVDRALRNLTDRPWFVLALARPEIEERFPLLWHERHVQHLRLAPLTKRASEKLAREALEGESNETIARIVSRAGGNAFFLEELVRSVATGAAGDELPGTVLAMAQSRLERLDPTGRQVLRAASIFGQTFWLEGVAALMGRQNSPAPIADWLRVLADRELIAHRHDGSATQGSAEFRFRHDLVREAAYAMLTDEDRTKGHRLAAEWLTNVGEKDPIVLAEHHEAGDEPQLAVIWYRRAAALALESNDVDGALARARKGLQCGAEGLERTTLRLYELQAHVAQADNDAILQLAPVLLPELPKFSDAWCATATSLVVARARLGETDDLIATGRELMEYLDTDEPSSRALIAAARLGVSLLHVEPELAASLGDRLLELSPDIRSRPGAAATIELFAAQRAFFANDLAQCIRRFERAISGYERAGDDRLSALHLGNLAEVHIAAGDYQQAKSSAEQSLALCDRMGMAAVSWGAHLNLGRSLEELGDPAAGADEAAVAADGFDGQGNVRMRGTARAMLALMLARIGDQSGADEAARQATEDLAGVSSLLPFALTVSAVLSLKHNDLEAAKEPLDRAWHELEERGTLEQGEALLRLTRAEWLHASGNSQAAQRAIETARDLIIAKADCIGDAVARDRFLSQVREHARTLELAEGWK